MDEQDNPHTPSDTIPTIIGPQSAKKAYTEPETLSSHEDLTKREKAQHTAEDELSKELNHVSSSEDMERLAMQVIKPVSSPTQPKTTLTSPPTPPAPHPVPDISHTPPAVPEKTTSDLEPGNLKQSPFTESPAPPSPQTPAPVPQTSVSTPIPSATPRVAQTSSQQRPTTITPPDGAPTHTEVPPVAPTPVAQTPVQQTETPSVSPALKTLRTYQGDMAGVVRNKNESVATIAVAAHKKREDRGESIPLSAARTVPFFKNAFFLILSAVVIVAGGFSLYTVFFAKSAQNTAIDIRQPESLVDYNTFSTISLTDRNTLIETINNGRTLLPDTKGSIWFAHITGASPLDLLKRLTPQAPDVLMRTLTRPYAVGFYRDNNATTFFAGFTVSSYGQAFSGMLAWEPTLYADISEFMPQQVNTPNTEFTDVIVDNKDVRVLQDTAGQTLVVYGFADQQTLVIAQNEAVFKQITQNILTKRTAR